MGHGRRRQRREALDLDAELDAEIAELADQVLSPTYVSVGARAWDAESDTPVLPLAGLEPWDVIAGPALALYDDHDGDALLPDSQDPSQLDLSTPAPDERPVAAERPVLILESEPAVIERPVLVLEPDPPVEVQAELGLQMPSRPAAMAPVIETPVVETVEEAPAPPEPPAPPPPDPVDVLFHEAREAAADGRLADARSAYRAVIAQRPAHLKARNNLALLLERTGDQQAALAEYDKAADLDGEHPTVLTNRGALLGAMGRYAAAERDLKKVLRGDPSDLEALFHLGVVMTRKGLWAEAVPQLRRVIELDPERGAAHFYLGEALNKVDDLYGAMAAYQRAAELLPQHPRALYGLGIVYDRLGRPDDAARMYRKSREVGRR